MVGSVVLTDGDDLVLAVQDGFARLDTRTGAVRSIARLDAHPDLRFNDGKCDPSGRMWAGTMALDERRDAGALYRFDPDGRIHRMLDDVTISNGLDWSASGATMYFIDSPTRTIDVFDFELTGGNIRNRRTFVRIPRGEGVPDGMTVDADGYVWVALWGGGAVHRYAPDGCCDTVVRVPTRYPTSCAFGGPDLGDLYITTAHVKLTPQERAEQPHAGGVFMVGQGRRARAESAFPESDAARGEPVEHELVPSQAQDKRDRGGVAFVTSTNPLRRSGRARDVSFAIDEGGARHRRRERRRQVDAAEDPRGRIAARPRGAAAE
jgi:sugar lactone lactonase YvrE